MFTRKSHSTTRKIFDQRCKKDFCNTVGTQRPCRHFDIMNNCIHDNKCAKSGLMGAGFSLNNVTERIRKAIVRNNSCGMGGAGFVQDTKQENTVTIEGNLVDNNHGTEPGASHGGIVDHRSP